MIEFEQIATEAGRYNDGLISIDEFRAFIVRFAAEAPESEIEILARSLVGTPLEMDL